MTVLRDKYGQCEPYRVNNSPLAFYIYTRDNRGKSKTNRLQEQCVISITKLASWHVLCLIIKQSNEQMWTVLVIQEK